MSNKRELEEDNEVEETETKKNKIDEDDEEDDEDYEDKGNEEEEKEGDNEDEEKEGDDEQGEPALILDHQDGPILSDFEDGGYCREENKITISVQFIPRDSDYLEDLQYCLQNFPLEGDIKVDDVYSHLGGMFNNDENDIKAWGYYGEHCDKIQITFKVLAIENDAITLELSGYHDDVNYMGEKAKDCNYKGRVTLKPKPKNDLWIPG